MTTGRCPGCGTAKLAHGRPVCQGCGVLAALAHPDIPLPSARPGGQPSGQHHTITTPPQVNTRWAATCALCGTRPPGPGGVLRPPCKTGIGERNHRLAGPGGDA